MFPGFNVGSLFSNKGRKSNSSSNMKRGSRDLAYVFLVSRPRTRMRIALRTFSRLCGWMLLALGTLSLLVAQLVDFDVALTPNAGPSLQLRRGSVYPSLAVSRDLRSIRASSQGDNWLWESAKARLFYGCSLASASYTSESLGVKNSGRYLMIETSGGLNQQRTGITDAVVVARMLQATLVIPSLDHNSYWKDSSNFSDIFDVEWFIKSLASDVPIVRELPAQGKLSKKERILTTRVPRKCTPECYRTKILPILQKRKVLRLKKFDYGLSNALDPELQKLRCRVNYHALQFTPTIVQMGRLLVQRMRRMSGRYIALHLRYESDMLAFSGCYYGGGDKEIKELGEIRKRWKTLHLRSPEAERRNGKCPLTPQEVGLMLRALGFGSDTYLYVASGEVYGGETSLAPLKQMFPNYFTKEALATKEELQPFAEYSSRMAALDFVVCDESNVFVANNHGNMARMLAGRRRYFDHKKTIRPNTKKLGPLFRARDGMEWDEFARGVQAAQVGFMGEPQEVKPGRGEFHENPVACICEKTRDSQMLPQVAAAVDDVDHEPAQGYLDTE